MDKQEKREIILNLMIHINEFLLAMDKMLNILIMESIQQKCSSVSTYEIGKEEQ